MPRRSPRGRQRAGRAARIGVLSFGVPEPFRAGFRQALLEHGYVEGRNLTIEYRWASGQTERLPWARGRACPSERGPHRRQCHSEYSGRRGRNAIDSDCYGNGRGCGARTGLVTNLARPGGNVTGLSLALIELAAKTVALFREAVPHVRRIACVVHRGDPLHQGFLSEVESSARRIGLHSRPFTLGNPTELGGALASIGRDEATGVIFQPIFVVDPQVRAMVVRLTLEHRLPSVSGMRRFAEAGGFVAYSSEFSDLPKRAAVYVDKILKGARPGDLPVEQPAHFQLAFNLKTAKALGLTIPPPLLLRADHVIE